MAARVMLWIVITATAALAAAPAVTSLSSGIDRSGFDTAVRPQDNFFLYVNGGWIQKTEIPADKSNWGSFNILREESNRHQREIIEKLAARRISRLDPKRRRSRICMPA